MLNYIVNENDWGMPQWEKNTGFGGSYLNEALCVFAIPNWSLYSIHADTDTVLPIIL